MYSLSSTEVCPNPSFAQQLRLFHILRDTIIEIRKKGGAHDGEAKEAEDKRKSEKSAKGNWPFIHPHQRERAERDYAMVRHISHMYHAAHKLSRTHSVR